MVFKEMYLILPEIIVTFSAVVVLILDLFIKQKHRTIVYLLSLMTLFFAAFYTLDLLKIKKHIIFSGTFVVDNFSIACKMLLFAFFSIIYIYSRKYLFLRNLYKSEFYILTLFSLLGMMILISSGNLLIFYLGLELFTLPLYVLMAFVGVNKFKLEASIKYFVMTVVATGFLLYGISLLYGVTGTFNFDSLSYILGNTKGTFVNINILKISLLFMFTGFIFKIGAAPFHIWIPDVYEGASVPITLMLSTLSKLVVFAAFVRLFFNIFQYLIFYWQNLLIFSAILSIGLGSIFALKQTNLKRMLGYSAISHMGYVLLGFSLSSSITFSYSMFYLIAYILATMTCFGVIIFLSYQISEFENISDFKGLAKRAPLISFIMMLALFSLAGIPPLVGFYAKVLILKALIDSKFFALSVIVLIFAIISAYYYLRIIKNMYFEQANNKDINFSISKKINLSDNKNFSFEQNDEGELIDIKDFDIANKQNDKRRLISIKDFYITKGELCKDKILCTFNDFKKGMSVSGSFLLYLNGLSLLIFGVFPFPLVYLSQMAIFK